MEIYLDFIHENNRMNTAQSTPMTYFQYFPNYFTG